MEVGFSYLGSCFQTAAAARVEHCTAAYPQHGSDGSGSYVVSCLGTSDTGLLLRRTDSAGGSAESALETSYASCYVGVIGRTPITPAEATQAFSWGLVTVFSLYLVAWGCGRVLDMVRSRP